MSRGTRRPRVNSISSSSDDDDTVLDEKTSPCKLLELARKLQEKRTTAEEEARSLRRELADVTNKAVAGHRTGSRRKRARVASSSGPESEPDSDSSNVSDDENDVKQAGRYFTMMHGLWLREKQHTFKLDVDKSVEEKCRFDKEDNKSRAQLLEIRMLLPPKLHSSLKDTWLRTKFMQAMGEQHSNTSTRLRRHIVDVFDAGLPGVVVKAVDLVSSGGRQEKFRHLIGWVVGSEGQGSYANLDVAVLHKDYKGKFDTNTVFLNPLLMHVFAAIIRGPTAALAMAQPAKAVAPPTDTMELRHGIKNITPGAIAASAVLTHWALSADDQLQASGAVTGIDYAAAFEQYLQYLMKGLWDRKPSVEKIIREWDAVLFPHTGSSLVRSQGDQTGDEFRSAMEQLSAEEAIPSDDEHAEEDCEADNA
ncbi:hypothetical protein OE88DRAFT_1739078 [Heliocybe sulcata]|uniref:Uncharacterized protein n=1 Tax=Heliocybe sulcata TaxID=5364 RepID=A0A5C3MQK6_9AGAM|nr:hypothetical protein OE88DRAFT_1739078 [Heliocybe sulcata]